MKNSIRLLFLTLLWTACQSTDPSVFGVDPQLNTYADEAPVAQKLFCNSVNCENPGLQEQHVYDSAGRLIRVDQLGRVAGLPITNRSMFT